MKYCVFSLKCWVLAFGLLSSVVLFANSEPNKVMESFEEGIPSGMHSTGELALDSKRMKDGGQSLKWEWGGNDQLIFDTPIGYRKQRKLTENHANLEHADASAGDIFEPPLGFFVWVYNKTATQQRLRVEFGRGEEVDCWFDFNLNFTGWRTIALNYDWGNMRGAPREGMNRMTINAPATGSGTFYFDALGFSVPMNPRTVGPNPQLPEIDQHPRLVAQYPHLLYEYSSYVPSFPLEPMSNDTVDDFRTLERRALSYWFQTAGIVDVGKIRNEFGHFNITRDADGIYGRPLVNKNTVLEYFSERGVPKKEAMKELVDWRYGFNGFLLKLARAWHYTDDPAEKEELAAMFIDLFDYGVDQGFAAGAGLGWMHHYSYIIREYAPSMLMMREVLKENGRLEQAIEICKWFYSFGQVYREDLVYGWKGRKAANADELQGILTQRLISALLMEDSPEKARDLKHFSSYFSNVATAYTNALDETYKPDGTVFHHAGNLYSYGGRAIYGGARTFDILNDTEFQASEESRRRLLKMVETYYNALFTDELLMPKTFSTCRFETYQHPEKLDGMFELLGESRQKIDGFRMLPYTSVGLRRKADDWMVTTRTHSKYVFPFESWGKNFFAFPLFIANGYTDVSYPGSVDSFTPENGTWYDGVDWLRWPGATAVNMPTDEVVTRVGQTRDEGGEYLFSDQAFSGGLETSHGVGIQVFQFKGHDKYGLQSFRGKKTWFFVGDKVLCLGSDIRSGIEGYPVETTLFQTHLESEGDSIVVNGHIVSEFPYELDGHEGMSQWFIDSRGTGYYVPEGGVTLTRSTQVNPDKSDRGKVSGNFATAWIDHGKAPQSEEYEYVLFADASVEAMMAYESNPSFEVLRQDDVAHIVNLPEEEATAYAVYGEDGASFSEGFVERVNKQSTFLVKKEGDRLRVSVSDPDLNIYDGQDDLLPNGTRFEPSVYEKEWFFWPSRSSSVQLQITGVWKIETLVQAMETSNVQARILSEENGVSLVEITCRDGLSTEFMLSQR